MKKRLLALFLVITALCSIMSTTAFAIDNNVSDTTTYELQVNDFTTITVCIPNKYRSLISEQELINIAINDGLHNGDCIEINHIESIKDEPMISPHVIIPPMITTYPTTLTKKGSEYQAENYFIISVAQGQTMTLEKAFSKTATSTFSVQPYSVTSELSASVTASYSVKQEFKGPSEDSEYNSREFRVRFYRQSYDYTQESCLNGVIVGTKSGTVNKPTRYALYSLLSKETGRN